MEVTLKLSKQECLIALKAMNAFRQKNDKEQKRSERKGMFPEDGRANIYEVHKLVLSTIGGKLTDGLKAANKLKE